MIKRTIEISKRDAAEGDRKTIDVNETSQSGAEWPAVNVPDLKPGETVFVRVKYERDFENTAGLRLFRALTAAGLTQQDGWEYLDTKQRAAYERAAEAIRRE